MGRVASGVCVGGPYAGRQVSMDRDSFVAYERAEPGKPKKTVYWHHEIAGFGIWTLELRNPLGHVMQALLTVYIAKHIQEQRDGG